MTWPTDVAAPVDPAGNGILVIGYDINDQHHRVKAHIQPVDTSTVIATGGNPDYNYSSPGGETFFGVTHGASEGTVQATAVALIGKLKEYYPNTVNFAIDALYLASASGAVPVYPSPQLGAEAGVLNTSGGLVTSGITVDYTTDQQFIYTMMTLHTRGGGRNRIQLTGAAGRELQKPQPVSGVAGGLLLPTGTNVIDRGLFAYLTGTGTRVVGHDGNPLTGLARVHAGVNKKTRRSVNWA